MLTDLEKELLAALRVVAEIPIEQFYKISTRQNSYILMAWNEHNITVGDVRKARAAVVKAETKQC